jgi:hypothetical protein
MLADAARLLEMPLIATVAETATAGARGSLIARAAAAPRPCTRRHAAHGRTARAAGG